MSKINQNIFSRAYVDLLNREVEQGNFNNYLKSEQFTLNEKLPIGKSIIEVTKDISLLLPDNGNQTFDIENSITIYNEFKNLNETQASDNRLWIYLTHVTFWNYMRKRWPLEKFLEDDDLVIEDEKISEKVNYIIWRYHLKTPNSRRLLRNGISRLWWYAHLTYDKNREDPFELTRVMLSNLDIAQNLLERSLGRNKNVLTAVLEYIRDHNELKRDDIRSILKELNLVGGVRLLPTLLVNEIKQIVSIS